MKPRTQPIEKRRVKGNGGVNKALFAMPEDLREMGEIFEANRPSPFDNQEDFKRKTETQKAVVKELMGMNVSLIEQMGSVSHPAIVTRVLSPLFEKPRFEVRGLDRPDSAGLGRALFVVADPALANEIKVGDVVVISADGSRIIDLDNQFARSGEYATIAGIHKDHDFPYELDVDGDGHLSRKMEAMKWERLPGPEPGVGDRVRVMGGVIHGFAPSEQSCRFKKNPWRTDLDRSDLHGTVPRRTLDVILAAAHRHLNPHLYLPRTFQYEKDYILLYGYPGTGKTHTVSVAFSMLERRYNNGTEKVVFLVAEGSAIEGSLVGSGPKTLRDIRAAAKKASTEGKLAMTFINEAGALLRSRDIQAQQLDAGSSLSTHEQFLALTSGPEPISGILISDLNTEKLLDEATRQRFLCFGYPHVDGATMVDQMFKSAFSKQIGAFEGEWGDAREALVLALDAPIGTILVGSETVRVRVGDVSSGRMYEKVIQQCFETVDLCIYKAEEQSVPPFVTKITPALLFYVLTNRSWNLFKCWDTGAARERLVPDLVRPDKGGAISKPTPFRWEEVEMPPEYDCREMLDGLLDPLEDIAAPTQPTAPGHTSSLGTGS
jgi:hypothetical protein